MKLVAKFGIEAGCIINKADLNPGVTKDIKAFLEESGIVLLSEIPYDEQFTAAMTKGKTVVEHDRYLGDILRVSWDKLKQLCGI